MKRGAHELLLVLLIAHLKGASSPDPRTEGETHVNKIAAFIFSLAVLLPTIASGMRHYPPPATHWGVGKVDKATVELATRMMQHGWDALVFDARALKR